MKNNSDEEQFADAAFGMDAATHGGDGVVGVARLPYSRCRAYCLNRVQIVLRFGHSILQNIGWKYPFFAGAGAAQAHRR
jgi:hypothetical protein